MRRATEGETDSATLATRLGSKAPTSWEQLRTDPLAIWTEQTFGLFVDDEGKLARQRPTTLATAAKTLADQTNVDEATCADKLRELLLAARNATDPQGRPLFAFKLHQFIGKGDTVYATLETPESRYLTTQYQRSAPTGNPNRPLFPLAFCRECGQDFLVVNLERGGESFSPRLLNDTRGEQADATGLLYLCTEPWPGPNDPALLDLVPDDWVITDRADRSLDPARRTRLPTALRVDEYGTATDDGLPVAFFERLDFCPSCKTSYESAKQSEFSRWRASAPRAAPARSPC